jgi:hypothetical protein
MAEFFTNYWLWVSGLLTIAGIAFHWKQTKLGDEVEEEPVSEFKPWERFK